MMSKQLPHPTATPAIEQTDIGPQYLIGGVAPITKKQRLDLLASLPMTPKRARSQKLCDIGLFDELARNQKDLFQ